MPRRSTRDEAGEYMARFFIEAKELLTADLLKTRQPGRRKQLFNEIAALDKVESRFYNWQNGVNNDAA